MEEDFGSFSFSCFPAAEMKMIGKEDDFEGGGREEVVRSVSRMGQSRQEIFFSLVFLYRQPFQPK